MASKQPDDQSQQRSDNETNSGSGLNRSALAPSQQQPSQLEPNSNNLYQPAPKSEKNKPSKKGRFLGAT